MPTTNTGVTCDAPAASGTSSNLQGPEKVLLSGAVIDDARALGLAGPLQRRPRTAMVSGDMQMVVERVGEIRLVRATGLCNAQCVLQPGELGWPRDGLP